MTEGLVGDAVDVTQLLRAQQFLLRAARVLAEAHDYIETLDRLAQVAVPLLGDVCLIDVLEDDHLVRMSARHADEAKQPLVDELRLRYPPDPAGAHPSAGAIRTGLSQWSADITEEFLRATTFDDRHFYLVTELGFTSYMAVPLREGDRIIGSLTLISAGSGRHFDKDELALAEELAVHATAVIGRARRHDRDREVAHALQRSLLPDVLPAFDGIAVAARYLPGTEGAEVGGDWYDVFPLPDGAVGVAIGDVAGHDIGAAAEMGQLRNALRAYAVRDIEPAPTLHELRRLCDVVGLERIATVTYATVQPATGEVCVATAGHFPPFVRRATGGVELVPVQPSPPLGVDSDAPVEARVHLGDGDAVVLVTDGLLERRGETLDDGLERLRRVLARCEHTSPEALCDHLVDAVLRAGQRDDDIALVVLTRATRRA